MNRLSELVAACLLVSIILAFGCDSLSSRSSLADKTKISAQQSEINVLTNKLSEQEALNKSLKNEIRDIKAKNVDLSNTTSTNNVWPWMIACIVLATALPAMFLTFLYFSNSWKGRKGL